MKSENRNLVRLSWCLFRSVIAGARRAQNDPEHVQVGTMRVCISARRALPSLRFYFLLGTLLYRGLDAFVSLHCEQDIQSHNASKVSISLMISELLSRLKPKGKEIVPSEIETRIRECGLD